MEAAFPRGKVATEGPKPPRGRSAGAERLFGAKPAAAAETGRERSASKKRSKSRDGSGKSGRSASKGASGGSKDSDFVPVASDKHTVRRADELSFKVCPSVQTFLRSIQRLTSLSLFFEVQSVV